MKKHLSIWFIIGLQFIIFGFLILSVSFYHLYKPVEVHTVYEEYHAGIYWGGLMLIVGSFYVLKFNQKCENPVTAENTKV